MPLRYPPRPASHWQSRDDAVRRIADRRRPKVAGALKAAFDHIGATVPVARMAELLRAARLNDAVREIAFGRLRDSLRHAFDEIAQAYEDGGRLGADALNRRLQAARVRKDDARRPGSVFAFDRFTPEVQATLRRMQDQLIVSIEASSRDAVERIILDGLRNARPMEEIARSIRNTVGLTPSQATAVENFRRAIERGDASVFQRKLRESFFDDELRRIIAGEQSPAAMRALIVDAYAERMRQHRAETIAITEASRAANLGLHESYRQMVARGAIQGQSVRRHWKTALDERMCEVCEPIPALNEGGVGVEQSFKTPAGPQWNPPLHPRCRCSVEYVTDLEFLDVGDVPGMGAGI